MKHYLPTPEEIEEGKKRLRKARDSLEKSFTKRGSQEPEEQKKRFSRYIDVAEPYSPTFSTFDSLGGGAWRKNKKLRE